MEDTRVLRHIKLANVSHGCCYWYSKVPQILCARQEIRLLPNALCPGLTFVTYGLKDGRVENPWNPRHHYPPSIRGLPSLGQTLGILFFFKKWAPQVILMRCQGRESLPKRTEWTKKEDVEKTRRISGRARVSRILLVFYFLTA